MATQGGVGGGGWVVFMNMGWGGGQGGSCLFIGCDVSRHHQRYLTVSLVIYALINLFRFIALVRAYRNSVLPEVSHCIICIG